MNSLLSSNFNHRIRNHLLNKCSIRKVLHSFKLIHLVYYLKIIFFEKKLNIPPQSAIIKKFTSSALTLSFKVLSLPEYEYLEKVIEINFFGDKQKEAYLVNSNLSEYSVSLDQHANFQSTNMESKSKLKCSFY